MAAAEARIARRRNMIETRAGPLEYAVAGRAPPLMMILGTDGGFDRGLLFAYDLSEAGFQIVAPSHFGYLRSACREDASPVHQEDVLVELLDHLGLDRIAVAWGSAGALTAAEFTLPIEIGLTPRAIGARPPSPRREREAAKACQDGAPGD